MKERERDQSLQWTPLKDFSKLFYNNLGGGNVQTCQKVKKNNLNQSMKAWPLNSLKNRCAKSTTLLLKINGSVNWLKYQRQKVDTNVFELHQLWFPKNNWNLEAGFSSQQKISSSIISLSKEQANKKVR